MRRNRFGAVRSRGRYPAASRRTGRRTAAPKNENRSLIRILICGMIFVFLVGSKLLFPEVMTEVAASAARIIGGDADFREAFAAIGRAVSGDTPVSDSLQEAYTAVFQPSHDTAIRKNDLSMEVSAPKTQTAVSLDAAAQYAPASINREATQTDCDAKKGEADSGSDPELYLALPENVSLQQRNLGFSYITPVQGTLTSSFGWREHPVSGTTRFHYGIDLAADAGTEIRAFADGKVFATGVSSTLGNYIILSHEDGYKTLYAHCSEVTVKSGAVKMGEKIAEVGDTGETTGAHLHFELQCGTLYMNPIYYVAIG